MESSVLAMRYEIISCFMGFIHYPQRNESKRKFKFYSYAKLMANELYLSETFLISQFISQFAVKEKQ